MQKRVIRRGEIYLSELDAEYSMVFGLPGIRPVIVVSEDKFNKVSDNVFIVHVTAPPLQRKNYPSYYVKLELELELEKAAGVNPHSYVRVDRLVSLNSSNLGSKLGMVSSQCLQNIEKAIHSVISVSNHYNNNYIAYNGVFKVGQKLEVEEDFLHEFKEVTSEKPVDRIVKEFGKYATAFLNEQGGRILWGINDIGLVKGVKLQPEHKDTLRKKIYQVISTFEPPVAPTSFEMNFHPVINDNVSTKDLYVFEVVVPSSLNPETTYYLNGSELWVKLNGVINRLNGPALEDYLLRKSGIAKR